MIRLTKIIKINNTQKYFILKHFCHTEASNNHHEIIVAGGGMVGSTMALALGKNSILNSKKVLLLEGRPQSKIALSETYSKRVSAITPTSVELFESLGAWEHIQQVRYAPVNCMQVWDGCSDAQITFNHDDFENLAYIVENNLILQSIEKELASLAAGDNSSIKLFYGAKIKSYDLPTAKEGVTKVTLEDGTTFTCDLLIGADGANSRIRNAMGVHYVHWNYDQRSIVATLHLADDMPNTTAWQRFTPDGPIALLPLTSKLSSLVWSTTSENARKISKLPNDQFVDAVNEAFFKQFPRDQLVDNLSKGMTDLLTKLNVNQNNNVRQLPPQIEGVDEGSRAVFPVGFGHCSNYVNHGVALVGDAAHRVHPLAGQGVNLGFQDVALLTKLIEEAVYRGSKIGNFALLKEYERKSQINNVPTVFGIDALHKLYSTSFMPLVLVRSLGLQAVHSLPLVKKLIMKYAQR